MKIHGKRWFIIHAVLLLSVLGCKRATEQAPSEGLSEDLVAYYPMNGDATDEGPSGYDGVMYGGVAATTDRHGNTDGALAFDGTGYIQLPSCVLPEMKEGTVMAWIFLDTLGALQAILDKTKTYESNDFQLIVYTNNKLRLNIDVHYGEILRLYSQTTLQAGRWYHVAVTWNGQVWRIYVDGQLDAEATRDRTVPMSFRTVYIGKVDNNTSFFRGKIDELRIFRRALSEEEIRSWMAR